MKTHTSWDIFYRCNYLKLFHKNPHERILSFTGQDYIFDCTFLKCNNQNGNGGAILCEQPDIDGQLLIERCVFVECTSKKYGGCIWYSGKGSSIFSKICCTKCSCPESGHTWKVFSLSSSNKNEIHQITVCNTVEPKKSFEIMWNGGGRLLSERINVSSNKISFNSVVIGKGESGDSYVNLEYSTIVNNSMQRTILYFNSVDAPQNSKCINILNNKESAKLMGTIYIFAQQVLFCDSCFLNNKGNTPVYNHGQKKIIFNNCAMDFNAGIIEKQAKTRFVNQILCFSTQNCFASFDAVGGITQVHVITQHIEKSINCIRNNFSKHVFFYIMLIHSNKI